MHKQGRIHDSISCVWLGRGSNVVGRGGEPLTKRRKCKCMTNGQTDGRTDKVTYRVVLHATKNPRDKYIF